MAAALRTVEANIAAFGDRYPADTTEDNVYPAAARRPGSRRAPTSGWTTSFWPGMLWLAYDLTGDDAYLRRPLSHVDSFARPGRSGGIDLDTHDLGFLYTLSCVAAWRPHR